MTSTRCIKTYDPLVHYVVEDGLFGLSIVLRPGDMLMLRCTDHYSFDVDDIVGVFLSKLSIGGGYGRDLALLVFSINHRGPIVLPLSFWAFDVLASIREAQG